MIPGSQFALPVALDRLKPQKSSTSEPRQGANLAVEGPGGVQASFDFRGAKNDVAGRMLTVTLTNDLDGSVYA